jgi:hypothetical protein
MSGGYGKTYPGSGGATDRPASGGEPWRPLPDGTFYQVPVTETVVDEHRPGFFGRPVGRETTYTEREVVVGHETRKHYR